MYVLNVASDDLTKVNDSLVLMESRIIVRYIHVIETCETFFSMARFKRSLLKGQLSKDVKTTLVSMIKVTWFHRYTLRTICIGILYFKFPY